MEHLPPPPVPLRPDLSSTGFPPRRRFPVWMVAVCVLVALVVGAAAMAPLLQGAGAEASGGPGFLFLDRTDQGGPTRWNPCEPIPYVVNARLAPPGSISDVHEA